MFKPKIFEASELPENEKIYLRKTFDQWQVVYPYTTENKLNWKNILYGGSWWKLIKWILILGIIILALWAYGRDTEICRQ